MKGVTLIAMSVGGNGWMSKQCDYLRTRRYTGSPKTMLVKWRYEPVSDIRRPPKDAYTVLWRCSLNGVVQIMQGVDIHDISAGTIKLVHLET